MSEMFRGKAVIPGLAEIFRQIYLVPCEENEENYKQVVGRGIQPEDKSLGHFIMDERDVCEKIATPAGDVTAVTLHQRQDFETLCRCITHDYSGKPLPATMGAIHIRKIVTWAPIEAHKAAFKKEHPEAGEQEWKQEFRLFTADKRNYQRTLIILSVGPYSAVSAERAGFPEEEWIRLSHEIRKYHECTHFVCKEMFPEEVDAIWDELVADAVGIYAALGRFDQRLEEIFLGIEDGKNGDGGRLVNYLKDEEMEKRGEIAGRARNVLEKFGSAAAPGMEPLVFAIELEKHHREWGAGLS